MLCAAYFLGNLDFCCEGLVVGRHWHLPVDSGNLCSHVRVHRFPVLVNNNVKDRVRQENWLGELEIVGFNSVLAMNPNASLFLPLFRSCNNEIKT